MSHHSDNYREFRNFNEFWNRNGSRNRNDSRYCNDSRNRNDSRYGNDPRYYNNSRYDPRSRSLSGPSHDSRLPRNHYHPRPPTSQYRWSKDMNGHQSSRSGQSIKSATPTDKQFTIVKPADITSDSKSFTIIKPDESCDFTIVTNQDNDFNQFNDPSKAQPKKNDIYSQLSLKQSNHFMFGSKTSSDVLKMCFLYAVARMIYENETDEAQIPAIAAAEFAADYLPNDRRLFGSQADVYFEQVMAKAVRDPNFILKVQPNEALYQTLEDMGLPRFYPTLKPEPLNGEQYMRILQILSTSLDPAYTNCDLVVTLTAIAPCLQLKSITQESLSRLESTVHQELGKKITLDIKSTTIFYEQYLKDASEKEVEEMLVCWRLTIPESAKQLRLRLKRSPGNGLLPIALIGRALDECDDFPWDKTLELYREDWKALSKAMLLIIDDPYYGYRRDKDDIVHPRHYQNLAWLGRQLCVQKLKDDYSSFNLWVEKPEHAEEIKRLITEYVAEPQQESTAMDQT